MSHLIDVNVLLALLWAEHPQRSKALAWISKNKIALCPLVQLGFLRISTNPKAYGATMEQARATLKKFIEEHKPQLLPDDLPPLDSKPKKSEEVTDHYLADLAQSHKLKLATFDQGLKHAAADVIG